MAGKDSSIPPSVGSAPHQASGSSSPCSHSSSGGSRHPVSALKKWLTNPVRKLSSDARGGVGKVEKQMCRLDGRQAPLLLSHTKTQLGPLEPHDNYTILPYGDTVRLADRQIDNSFHLNILLLTFYSSNRRTSLKSTSWAETFSTFTSRADFLCATLTCRYTEAYGLKHTVNNHFLVDLLCIRFSVDFSRRHLEVINQSGSL